MIDLGKRIVLVYMLPPDEALGRLVSSQVNEGMNQTRYLLMDFRVLE